MSWWYVTGNGQWLATFYSDIVSAQAIVGAMKKFPGVTTLDVYRWDNGIWHDVTRSLIA